MAKIATGSDVVVQLTPTVTAGAYAAGNTLGGLLTFANGLRVPAGGTQPAAVTATLLDITITDKGNQKPVLTILFLKAVAVSYTDKATPALALDRGNIVGMVSISSTAWVTSGSDNVAVAQVSAGPILLETTDKTANIYAVALVVSGTPTPTSTTDYVFSLKLLQD